MPPTLKSLLGRRSAADVVGLDIQPGFVAAVKVRVNGGIVVERAAVRPLPADAVREGEVVDRGVLGETLRELFQDSGLGKRVRVGVANQRTVMRTLELPPIDDRKALATAISFQAQDQVPMPLANAVLDFHPLGVIDTPDGPRERVVLVAAQRDMVESLLDAVRSAGLHPEGVDLSAFALIRSLYRADATAAGRVLYLNVDGLTNLAIADGPVCSFTRVVGSGLEGMAAELAERRGIPVATARELISEFDLGAGSEHARSARPTLAADSENDAQPEDAEASESPQALDAPEATGPAVGDGTADLPADDDVAVEHSSAVDPADVEVEEGGPAASDAQEPTAPQQVASEAQATYAELVDVGDLEPRVEEPASTVGAFDEDIRTVIENGIREIAGEVRNSLDFHRSQEPAGEVAHVALSGAALGVGGFAEALAGALDMEVRAEQLNVADKSMQGTASANRLAVATGLATLEAPR